SPRYPTSAHPCTGRSGIRSRLRPWGVAPLAAAAVQRNATLLRYARNTWRTAAGPADAVNHSDKSCAERYADRGARWHPATRTGTLWADHIEDADALPDRTQA